MKGKLINTQTPHMHALMHTHINRLMHYALLYFYQFHIDLCHKKTEKEKHFGNVIILQWFIFNSHLNSQ